MKSKTATTYAIPLVAIMAMASPVSSHAAGDAKIFPGSVCQPVSTEISATRMFYSRGGVVNFTKDSDGLQVARLSCPVLRDTVHKKWKKIAVRVRDNSSIAHVICTATAYSPYETSQLSMPPQKSGGSSASFRGYKLLTFDRPTKNFDRGAFNVYCELPGNVAGSSNFSAIHSIRVEEE